MAAAITALQLLWPALQALEGSEPELLPRVRVGAAAELLAEVEGSQASSRIGSLQGADLLLEIPAELGALEAQEANRRVRVRSGLRTELVVGRGVRERSAGGHRSQLTAVCCPLPRCRRRRSTPASRRAPRA